MSFTYLLSGRLEAGVVTLVLSHAERFDPEQYRTLLRQAVSEVVELARIHNESAPQNILQGVTLLLTSRHGFVAMPHQASYTLSFSPPSKPTPFPEEKVH